MRVMEGQSFEIGNSGHWKKIEVDVDLNDFAGLMYEWKLDEFRSISTQIKFFILTLLAQQLLAYRVFEAGGYTESEYQVVSDAVKKKLSAVKAKVIKDVS